MAKSLKFNLKKIFATMYEKGIKSAFICFLFIKKNRIISWFFGGRDAWQVLSSFSRESIHFHPHNSSIFEKRENQFTFNEEIDWLMLIQWTEKKHNQLEYTRNPRSNACYREFFFYFSPIFALQGPPKAPLITFYTSFNLAQLFFIGLSYKQLFHYLLLQFTFYLIFFSSSSFSLFLVCLLTIKWIHWLSGIIY